jgi:hypothetical protein
MGMLFNTSNTLAILELLHERYVTEYSMHNSVVAGTGDAADHASTTMSTYNIASKYGIDLGPAHTTRWQTWLNSIDGNPNRAGLPPAAGSIGAQIRAKMVTLLKDSNCQAIEFFAVPSDKIAVLFPPITYTDSSNTRYWAYIVIETVTYDNAAAWVRSQSGN